MVSSRPTESLRWLAAACALVAPGALVVSCASDVVVGLNPRASEDGGTEAAVAEAGEDASGASDAAVDAAPDARTLGAPGGALGAASRTAGGFVLAGHVGGAEALSATSDVWSLEVGADAAPGAELRVDVSGASDAATAVAAYPDGGALLVGFATVSGHQVAWIRRRAPDGSELWTRTLDTGPNGRRAEAVAVSPTGAIVVAGNEGLPEDGWVAGYADDGTRSWLLDFRTSGAANTRLFAVTIGQFRRVYAAGVRPVDSGAGPKDTPTVIQISETGVLFNSSVSRFPAGTEGTVRGMVSDGLGTSILCADTATGPALARIDDLFTTSEPYVYALPEKVTLAGCAFSTDGALHLVGTVQTATGNLPWLAKHDLAPFVPRFTRTVAAATPTRGFAVAPGPSGSALVAGRTESPAAAFWKLEGP